MNWLTENSDTIAIVVSLLWNALLTKKKANK